MLVPAGSLAGVSWLQGPLGLLAALVVGIPMYVCSTASVPIAAGMVQAGFPAGAAVVFLMAGPATNAATLGAVRKTLGGKVFVIYLGTIVFFSLLAGLVMNAIGFSPGPAVAEGPSPLHVLQVAAGGILAAGIAWFAGMDLLALLSRLRARASTGSTILAVDEINCPTCESKVRAALLQLEGVRVAVVSRDSGTAFLSTAPGFDPEKALELVKGLGYTARLL
jgi:copper chaperone CopZ